MTTLDLTVACFVTLALHVAVAVFYSRKYIPIVGLAVHAYCPDYLTIDYEDPVKSAYPLIDGMSTAELRTALSNELRDLHMICDNATEVFMHVTDGRFSKPNTRSSAVNALHDELVQDAVDYAVRDALNEDGE